jgi:hypothetical protein
MNNETTMKRLDEQMRNRMAKQPLIEDLEMLNRAAEAMKRTQERAVQSEARAQSLVTHAQAELKITERLLQESDAARIEAENEQRKLVAKLEEAQKFLEARNEQVLEIQKEGEERCKAAEQRAQEAEDELQALREAMSALFKDDTSAPAHKIAAE